MVEILLPFYGDPNLLRTAVQSVLWQRSADWTLTIVDDGYPDPSVQEWCTAIDDDRVRYLRNEVNLGANRNYAYALSLATQDYVVLMGADDVMLPNYLDVATRTISAFPGIAVVQPGVGIIDEHGAAVRPLVDRIKSALSPRTTGSTVVSGEPLAARLLLGNWAYFPALCWNRRLISDIGFRARYDVVQDLALLLDVAMRGGSFAYDPELAFLYRRHAASDSGQRTMSGHRFDEERAVFAEFADEFERHGWPSASRAARLHLTSRLHAAALAPRATVSDRKALVSLLRHVVATR